MNLADLIARQRRYFDSGATRLPAGRQTALARLAQAIAAQESALLTALRADLGKSPVEAYSAEIGFVLAEIRHARGRLDSWCRPRRRSLPWLAWPGRASVQAEPFGVALIIGPWNYPFQLLVAPLVGALAAGNCAVLKPSELAPHTAGVIARLIQDAFPPEQVAVVEGDRTVAEALLREKFDTIFFTGSSSTGRAVMAAAARHLTPVTLELGGKSPCLVLADAPLAVTARRIAWGKFLNAGQTCVAPDFVLAERPIHDGLVEALQTAVRQFYGTDPQQSPEYARIINRRHFDRLSAFGVTGDPASLYLPPTILPMVSWDAPIMQEEIFGPLLPVLPVDDWDQALAQLRRRPTPLALYLFTSDRRRQEQILAETRSGGACINDTVVQITGPELPLGGLGESGMGRYHGRASFEAFSHQRTVVRRALRPDLPFRYPPTKLPLPQLKQALRWLLR